MSLITTLARLEAVEAAAPSHWRPSATAISPTGRL